MNNQDQVSEVYPAGTCQLAFAAEHAFADLLLDLHGFTSSDECMEHPDIEHGVMAAAAGGRTASATDALVD